MSRYGRSRQVARYRPGAVAAFGGAARGLVRYGAKRLMQSSKRSSAKKESSTRELTTQYDVQRQYTRKRMPRRRRKGWVRFIKKVGAVQNKRLPNSYQVFRSVSSKSVAAGVQALDFHLMYGANGDPTNGGIDITTMLQSTTVGDGAPADRQTKFNFKSATLDMEISAASTNTTSIVVDIYEIIARKSLPFNGPVVALGDSPAELFVQGCANTEVIGSAGTKIAADQPGVTPFQSSLFCKSWLIRKKDRVLLSPGQACQKLLRDAKDRSITYDSEQASYALRAGWTKGYMLVGQAVTDGTAYSPAFKMNSCSARTYSYVTDGFHREIRTGLH